LIFMFLSVFHVSLVSLVPGASTIRLRHELQMAEMMQGKR